MAKGRQRAVLGVGAHPVQADTPAKWFGRAQQRPWNGTVGDDIGADAADPGGLQRVVGHAGGLLVGCWLGMERIVASGRVRINANFRRSLLRGLKQSTQAAAYTAGMDKLRHLHCFVAIAERGSLTAAAAALGVSLPTVVRQLAALEAHLGARLIERTTRRMALTAEGQAYLSRCRDALALLAEADHSLQAQDNAVRGLLRVTAPVLFGEMHVAALLARLTLQHPALHTDLLLTDRFVSLVEEGMDVGIRIGPLRDSSLVAVPLGTVRSLVVASPAWLAQHGPPHEPIALRNCDCLSSGDGHDSTWLFQRAGRGLRVPVRSRLRFNHPGAALRACEAGAGVGMFLSYQVREAVDAGRLCVLLADFERPAEPVQLVLPQARLLPARTRAFIDAARAALPPALNTAAAADRPVRTAPTGTATTAHAPARRRPAGAPRAPSS